MKSKSSFSAPARDLVEYEEQIEQAKWNSKKKGSTREEAENEITKIKQSFSTHRSASSMSTVFALVNSMVGSVCLVIPISFSSAGLIMSIIVMFAIGLISMKTSQLYLIYLKDGETDLSQMIERTLGKKYALLFNFSSSLLMFLVGNIYFLLINQTAYPMLCFLFGKFGANSSTYVSQNDMNSVIAFNQFSIQWLGLIVLVCVFPLFLIKNMKMIIKLAHGGFFAIGLYVIFVIYTFFDNVATGNLKENISEVSYFSSDIASIAGSFALAFMVHNAIAQIMSQNSVPSNNNRDMSIGYLLAACIYGLIGIFGSYGIVGRSHPDNSYTITQYFNSDSVPPFIINLCFAGHLITAFPLFCYISKTQFFNIIFPTTPTPKIAFLIYNIIFASSCFFINMFNVNPGIVIGITGAVVGFVIVYFLPILIHLKYQGMLPKFLFSNNNEENEEQEQLLASNASTTANNSSKQNKILSFCFYTIIMGIGVYLAVIQLIDVFK